MPIARRIRDRVVAPPDRRGQRALGLTCAATLWCLRSGPLRGPELLGGLDGLGLAWSDEAFYQGTRRWERLGLITIRKVPSRDLEAGAPGAPVENLHAITMRGREALDRFLATVDLMT